MDPSNPDRILAATTPGGSFQIAAPIAAGDNVAAVAFSVDGSVLYGLTLLGSAYRSTNLGQSWALRSNGLPGAGDIGRDIVVSPAGANIAYAGFQNGGLFKTIDGGMNWGPLGLANQSPNRIAVDPANSDKVLVATGIGMYRSTNAGQNWTQTASGHFLWVGFDPMVAGRAVAVPTIGPVLRSSDGGATWANGAINSAAITYDGSFDRSNPGALLVGTGDGVLWSGDGGASVENRSLNLRAALTTALATTSVLPGAVYASFYPGPGGVHRRAQNGWEPTNNAALRALLPWPFAIETVAVDPTDSATLYAGGQGGVAKSVDSGASWILPSSVFTFNRIIALAIDPSDSQVLYAADNSLGIMRSGTGGATWVPRNTGLPTAGGITAMQGIVVDPADSNVLYATTVLGTRLFKSIDAGQNWSPAESGLPSPLAVQSVRVDPSDSAIVYAATGGGLFRTTNGGLTWAPLDLGFGGSAHEVLIDPVVTSNLVTVNLPNGSGALRSVDAGQTWEPLPFSSPSGSWLMTRAVLDPLRPNVIIAASQGLGVAEIEIAPDLALTVLGIDAELPIGSSRTATLTLENLGPFAASEVATTLTVPTWIAPGAATTPRGTCSPVANGVRCRIGVLRPGERIAVTVPLDVASSGTGSVSASVAAHESDITAANNVSNIDVTALEIADMAVTLTPDRATIDNRESVRLTARASNSGPSPVSAALVSVPLAAGLTFASANSTRGACTSAAGTVTCSLGLLASGEDATIEINATASAVGSLVTTATVSGANPTCAVSRR